MSSSARRSLIAVAAVCTFGLLAFAPSASAAPARQPVVPISAPPVPPANVIVVPDATPVSDSVYASGITWLATYLATETTTAETTTDVVVSGPEQVTGTVDTAGMDWLARFAGSSSAPTGQ